MLAVVSSSVAAEWESATADDESTYYVDRDTIRKSGNKVKIWELSDYKTAQGKAAKKHLSQKLLYEYDCTDMQGRMLSFIEYPNNMGGGKVVSTGTISASPDWKPISPGSVGEKLWKIACGKISNLELADSAYDREDYVQAIKLYRPLAATGNAQVQNRIGRMYYVGKGVSQNDKEALKWYRLSAAQGNAAAQYNLGGMYYDGIGVSQNYKEALKWYRLSAAQGLAAAQNNLGGMYRDGIGVSQNDKEALKWLRLAADQGKAAAQYNLGWMYRKGIGVSQNYKEALKWYRLSAAQGDAVAQNELGWMYRNGTGVTKDSQEALKWYRLAADQGLETAKKALEVTWGLNDPIVKADTWGETDPVANVIADTPIKGNFVPFTGKLDSVPSTPSAPTPKLAFNSSTSDSDGTVELSGRVISSANISEVSINGRLLEMPLAKDGSFKVVRRLPMGMTTYRLSVVDEFDQRADAEINVERVATQYTEAIAPLDPRKMRAKVNPNAVALIIGVESYSNLPQAQYADSDANHFYDYAHQALGVPTNKIKLLIDAKASRIELLKAMRSWLRTEVAGGKSDVYIFFAGHGLASADGSKTYLLPADGDRDLLDETSILRDDLIASAKGAKTITMFLDTCYSGGTRTKEILLTDARPIAIVPDKSALPSNVTVLAAASGAQLSSTYEAAQQGLFSYWLMKGLEGDADTNQDKKITAGELHDYVAKQVGPMAQRRNRQQDPQLMGDSTRVLVSY